MCAYPHTYVFGMLTFRPLVTPGVSASTINPVNPLNPFLMSGSVRASTKYLQVIAYSYKLSGYVYTHARTHTHTKPSNPSAAVLTQYTGTPVVL